MDHRTLPSKLLIGTTNSGKIAELRTLLRELPLELIDLNETIVRGDVAETGATFIENASIKASAYATQTGQWTLADDSGLEVAALGNAPGVLSARYGGESLDFGAKIRLLLNEVARTRSSDRSARFVCAVSIADPTGDIAFTGEGICSGHLSFEPRGTNGFGYDPIFIPDGFASTFGELDDEIKQQISHRAKAGAKIMQYLQGFYAV